VLEKPSLDDAEMRHAALNLSLIAAGHEFSLGHVFAETGKMTAFSLQEAADQTRTSRADIWRAIQAGSLPAERLPGGGFAIDPVELFRVFERPALLVQRSPEGVTAEKEAKAQSQQEPTAAPRGSDPEPATTLEPDSVDEIAGAFAARAVELKGLIGERRY
jgi:hypothetical protein